MYEERKYKSKEKVFRLQKERRRVFQCHSHFDGMKTIYFENEVF